MGSKFGEEEEDVEVELELCLSLGGPFNKSKPKEICRDAQSNAVNLDGETKKSWMRRKREPKQEEQRECKRIRTECNGTYNGVTNGVNLDLSFSKIGNGYGSGLVKESNKSVTTGSPICSSSDISDPSSSSPQEGGRCENSVQTKPVNKIGTGTKETKQRTDGSNGTVVVEAQDSFNNSVVAKGTSKPPKPRPNGNGVNTNLLPFAQMPCVTSTGNGPEGKTVNGFLYRYSKSEVSIICVCHGTSFSPAEFIVHAGGTNVSHPLRHITVVPSTL